MLILFFALFLCWGSFLNVLAYRLVHLVPFWRPRSACPLCKKTIAWYYNIPVLSWLWLHGRCAYCKQPISILYPFIELLTASLMTVLITTVPLHYFPAYFLFFSALIITIRTDLETMLISRFATLFLIPFGLIGALLGYLPLTITESLAGAAFGYGSLWAVASLFYTLTGKEGMGRGDVELLAFIGACIGASGVWATLVLGSVSGSVVGIIQRLVTGEDKIPFGPFLALGAIAYVLLQPLLMMVLWSHTNHFFCPTTLTRVAF